MRGVPVAGVVERSTALPTAQMSVALKNFTPNNEFEVLAGLFAVVSATALQLVPSKCSISTWRSIPALLLIFQNPTAHTLLVATAVTDNNRISPLAQPVGAAGFGKRGYAVVVRHRGRDQQC